MVNNSVFATMLTIAGTQIKTVEYCSWCIDLSASSIDVSGHALVFNRGALGVDNDDFDEKFSLAKTLTSIRGMRIKFVLKDVRFILNAHF
jgi:hypothetical protein